MYGMMIRGLNGGSASGGSGTIPTTWNRCDPNLDNYGEYDYDEHDSNDSGNSDTEFSRAQARDRVRAFLRDRHPDLLEELA